MQLNPKAESQADLYSTFKKAQSSIQKQCNALSIAQLISAIQLQGCYDSAKNLVQDLGFCFQKNIAQRLWSLVRLYLTNFLEKHHEDNFLLSIDKFYDAQMKLMRVLIKALLEQYTENKLEKNQKNEVISRVCVYYGEVLESREKTALTYGLPPNQKAMQQASNFYLKAIQIYPYNGSFYSRLAVMTAFNNDLFSAYYWSMRAETCEKSEPKDEKLKHVLQQKIIKNQFDNLSDGLKNMSLHLAIYHNSPVSHGSFIEWNDLFRSVIRHLTHPNQIQLTILSYAIHLCLQSVYKVALSGNLKQSYYELKQNFSYRNIIRNNFYIILSTFELFNKLEDATLKSASMLLMPVINFLIQYPNVLKLVLQEFPQLENAIQFIYSRYLPLKTKDRISYKIFSHEVNLLGWIVLKQAYEGRKKELETDSEVMISWIIDSLKLLGVDLNVKGSPIKIKYPTVSKVKIQKLMGTKQKNMIVVDGRNVAVRHGNHEYFSSKGLKIVSKYWRNKGYQIYIILPEYCFSIKQIENRREKQLNEKTLPDDTQPILQLRSQGIAISVPDHDYDDAYIVDFAMNKQAFILSNDTFKDFREHARLGANQKLQIRQFFRNYLMTYTFIEDDFIPNPEFVKKKNIL